MKDNPRLKRLLYRSWHRGCKETDVVLGHFAETHLAAMDDDMLDCYERLLDEQDHDIWGWITEKAIPAPAYTVLINALKKHTIPNP